MDERCSAAIEAAMQLIKEKCRGAGKEITIEGVKITAPAEVWKIAGENPELTREQRVEAIMETEWAKNLAHGWVTKVLGLTPTTREYEEMTKRIARRVAEGMV